MTFEFLPNEIIIDCFQYLNAPDIFHSFEQLNYRFNTLIRNISLDLNCQHISKTIFDRFCLKMFSEPTIKSQIRSLQLSNATNTCHQIETFLSRFSLDDFHHLRSLVFVRLDPKNFEKIRSILPNLSNLQYFYGDEHGNWSESAFSVLSRSTIRTLSVYQLLYPPITLHDTTLLRSLSTHYCSWEELDNVFKYAPMLKYLTIKALAGERVESIITQAVCLTHLTVTISEAKFVDWERLLSQTPNVKVLILSANGYDEDLINAHHWQYFISAQLLHLKIFNFDFQVSLQDKSEITCITDYILSKFQQFQTSFWLQQHHWYSECQTRNKSAIIYTIPYILHNYTLAPNIIRHYTTTSMSNSKVFDNVTYLSLDSSAIASYSCHYFPNVETLELYSGVASDDTFDYSLLQSEDIQSLKSIVNLYNIKHLNVKSSGRMKTSSTLLKILKEAPHISSLTMYPDTLRSLFDDHELCKYLNRMIKNLDIWTYSHREDMNFKEIEQICEIFSNLEQFKLANGDWNDLLLIFTRLPKLRSVIIESQNRFSNDFSYWLKDLERKSNKSFLIKSPSRGIFHTFSIWIGEKTFQL